MGALKPNFSLKDQTSRAPRGCGMVFLAWNILRRGHRRFTSLYVFWCTIHNRTRSSDDVDSPRSGYVCVMIYPIHWLHC